MLYPSSVVQYCCKQLLNCLSRDSFVSCTCGIQEWRKMKCPITGIVCGNMSNTTKHVAISNTRPNSRHKSAQTFENLAPLRIVRVTYSLRVSHSGLLATIRPERDQWPAERWPLCPQISMRKRRRTHTNTCSHIHVCNTIIWTMRPLFFLPNSDAHMRPHTQVSLLFPKIPCSCFLSLRLCVFLCTPEFLFAFTFFPKQGKGKQKHNERIKGDYRLSEF